jgi:protein gp37
MLSNSRHTFIILTKRPDRMAELVPRMWRNWPDDIPNENKNIWLGVSVENQATYDARIKYLLDTPAAIHFISYEPGLGPLDMRLRRSEPCDHFGCFNHVSHPCEGCGYQSGKLPIDWIICGGETGPDARPMHPDWARSLRDQCQASGTPFFFKSFGEWRECRAAGIYLGLLRVDYTDGSALLRVGKKNAGRLLDGREWNEFPEAGTTNG